MGSTFEGEGERERKVKPGQLKPESPLTARRREFEEHGDVDQPPRTSLALLPPPFGAHERPARVVYCAEHVPAAINTITGSEEKCT